jgi:ferritin-like metal-binding protein YciE
MERPIPEIKLRKMENPFTAFARFRAIESDPIVASMHVGGCAMATTKDTLQGLYLDELRDIYSAERQLTKALPKMAKATTSEELRNGFTEHLEQTRGHVARLEEIFEALGERATGKKCAGMEGLIEEGSEVMGEDFTGDVRDAALIAAAQRVEHYEIAAYGTVCAFAGLLGESEHVSLLQQTLNEEKHIDKKLTELAQQINIAANEQSTDAATSESRKRGHAA